MKQQQSSNKKTKYIQSRGIPPIKAVGLATELKDIFALDARSKPKAGSKVYKKVKARRSNKNLTTENSNTEFKATSTPFTSLIIEPLTSNKIEEIQKQISLSKEINKIHDSINNKHKHHMPGPAVVASAKVEKKKKSKRQTTRVKVNNKSTALESTSVIPPDKKQLTNEAAKAIDPVRKPPQPNRSKRSFAVSKSKTRAKSTSIRIPRTLRRSVLTKALPGRDPIDLLGTSHYKLILRRIS